MQALLLVLLASLLTGCAGVRLVDAQVQAIAAGATIEAGAPYRFERLPSQAGQLERVEQMEALAAAALAQVGLRHDDMAARYSVQVGMRVQGFAADVWGRPMSAPWGGIHGHVLLGVGNDPLFGMGLRMPPPPLYRREVSLLIRDLGSNQLVYETRASNDSPWPDDQAILPVLFEAALRDFPHPPAGTRHINIEIPR